MEYIRVFVMALMPFGIMSCSASGTDPCPLLTLSEVQDIVPGATKTQWHPRSTSAAGDNDLCIWSDASGADMLYMFLFTQTTMSPIDHMDHAMGYAPYERVLMDDVGELAVASFISQPYKNLALFEAKQGSTIIGFRVFDTSIPNEDDENFLKLKDMANNAFRRL